MHHNHSLKVLVLYAGDFGHQVAGRLAQYRPLQVHPLLHLDDDVTASLRGYEFICVASWRPYTKLYKQIDEFCHEQQIPWSVVDVHGDLLRCGPLVIPRKGPCYHCFYKRLASHAKSVERDNVIEAALQRDNNLGFAGYVAPMVEIAAAALAEDITSDADNAGRFRFIDVVSSSVRRSEVIGVHNCPRCRRKAESVKQADRFVTSLVPALEDILQ